MSRKRWMIVGALVVAAPVLAFAGVKVSDTLTFGHIATGYAAQQTCACMNVSGRTRDSCLSDFPPEQAKQFKIDATADRVRVSALNGAFKAEATYDERYGCRLVN